MRRGLSVFFGCLLPGGSVALALAQPPQPSDETIRARATTVLVDVVVRHRDRGALRGLRADQFEVLEDGVPQKVIYFQEMGSGSASLGGGDTPTVEPDLVRGIPGAQVLGSDLARERFIALVFDRLSPTSRSNAREAAVRFVQQARSQNPRIGVFLIDLSLRTLQFYTQDTGLVVAAIDRAMGAATSQATSVAGEIAAASAAGDRAAAASAAAASSITTGPGADNQGAAQIAGVAEADALLAAMQQRMAETLEILQRDQQGHVTTDGLLAVVRALALMPARKTVVFFSEGVSLPEAVIKRFRSVINAANRSNVAVYAVDAAGLRVESTGQASLQGISDLAGRRQNQAFSGREDTSGPMLRQLERNETLIRADPHTGLNMLAEETGGFLIRDTNNLAAGLGRISEDMESYYLLAYTPSNQNLDGRFRRIEVRVNVPAARVQFRRGYYAVDVALDEPLLEYEAPAVALLGSGQPRQDFELRAGAFNFPEPDRPANVALLVDVPPGTLSYAPDENQQEVSDYAIVAAFCDQSGAILHKTSQQYRLARASVGGGDGILFYREVRLEPGHYQVKVAAFDSISGKGAVRELSLEIPAPPGDRPLLSSLIAVDRAEAVRPGSAGGDTLLSTGELLLYPNLDTPISRSRRQELPFYFTAYSKQPLAEAYVELLEYGKRISLNRIQLPGPDPQGRIRYLGSIPITRLEPGIYTLRVLLPAGDQLVGRDRRLVLVQ